MTLIIESSIDDGIRSEAFAGGPTRPTSSTSGLSWGAITAGAVAAAAASVILLAVGSSIGLASVTPWAITSASIGAFTLGAAIWLVLTQWIASGIGGYLAGRLRARWPGTHDHEVFFRDTAHGFLAWAVATLFTLTLISMAAGTSLRSGDQPGALTGRDDASVDLLAYDVDYLFRSDRSLQSASLGDARLQADRILKVAMITNAASPQDKAYLAQLVVQETGASPAIAQGRIGEVLVREQEVRQKLVLAADVARKSAATLAIYTALSMLIGALIASVAAALGGLQRERNP